METQNAARRMPVLFVGHGSPLNVIEDNAWSRGFAALAGPLPTPRAILAVSAHWFVPGTFVTGNAQPPTIHDFGGFPPALYEIEYPAPGDPALAERVRALLGPQRAALNAEWGLDHGTWSVLKWMVPRADIPVIQLSIDDRLEMRAHLELGRALAPLREEGVLILGSGNVTHNLADAGRRRQLGSDEAPDWAVRFDDTVRQVAEEHDAERLLGLWPDSEDGRLAHPTPDHFIPLLYAFGAAAPEDPVAFPIAGFSIGSLSMRSIRWG